MEKSLYRRVLIRTIIIVATILICIFLLPRLLDALLPIIIAFAFASLINPIISIIENILPIKQKIISYIIGTILLLSFLLLGFWLGQIIISQILGLANNIIGNWSNIERSVNDLINKVNSDIKLLPPIASNAINSSLDSLLDMLNKLQSNVLNITFNITSFLINTSSTIIFFMITMIIAFYIILGDLGKSRQIYISLVSESTRKSLNIFWRVFKSSTINYIKSQAFLSLLCFILMSITLYFLGQTYFIILGLILGVVDLMPMVGTMIMLLPWSILEFVLFNNPTKAVGLIVMAFAWALLRQAISPRVIGNAASIHPLISTISLYAGLKIAGVWGAIFAPVIAIFIVGMIKSGLLDNWFYDYKHFYLDIKDGLDIKKRKLRIPKK